MHFLEHALAGVLEFVRKCLRRPLHPPGFQHHGWALSTSYLCPIHAHYFIHKRHHTTSKPHTSSRHHDETRLPAGVWVPPGSMGKCERMFLPTPPTSKPTFPGSRLFDDTVDGRNMARRERNLDEEHYHLITVSVSLNSQCCALSLPFSLHFLPKNKITK